MAKKKYIGADDALNAGLNLEVAPTVQKEITADSQGRYVGQNGLTASDLNMVGTGQYMTATDWNKMGDGYSIVTNPYAAASAEQVAKRQQASQVSTNRNDMELMSDDAYREILKYQQDWANATTDEERQAAHDAAEAVRARYGYSGGADGSDYLGLMAYTGGMSSEGGEDDRDTGYGGAFGSNGFANLGGFSYETAPQYLSKYQERIDALADSVLNRKEFTYDPETDSMYQQYKESYTRGGQRGMQDTLAQVSARTGGLASSYAQSAAQQTYNNYMTALADKIPELRQLAYSMYMDDLNQDRADLSMLQGLEQADYGKYLDQLGQWNADRGFEYGKYRDDVSDSQWQTQFDYGAYRDSVADAQWQQNFNYQQAQDALAQQNWQSQFDYQMAQDALAQQNWQTQWDYNVLQDELARQDALNKLYAKGSGTSNMSTLQRLYGLGSEAEAYDFLVSSGMSNAEVNNYMGYWKQNQNDMAYQDYLDGPENTDSYRFVDEDLKAMLRDGEDHGYVMKRLDEAYQRDLITKTEYESLKAKYRE